jgi:hypothetical protein
MSVRRKPTTVGRVLGAILAGALVGVALLGLIALATVLWDVIVS